MNGYKWSKTKWWTTRFCKELAYALNVLCLGLKLTWFLFKRKRNRCLLLCCFYIHNFYNPKLLNWFFPENPIELKITVNISCHTDSYNIFRDFSIENELQKLRLFCLLVTKFFENHIVVVLCFCTTDVLNWGQFRGSFLIPGKRCFSQHCDLICDKSVLYTSG